MRKSFIANNSISHKNSIIIKKEGHKTAGNKMLRNSKQANQEEYQFSLLTILSINSQVLMLRRAALEMSKVASAI